MGYLCGFLMVVTAWAVCVSVIELFVRRGAHANDLNFKVQILASQGVVAADEHVVAFDAVDGEDHFSTFLRRMLGAELEAFGQVLLRILGEHALGDFDIELVIDLAVRILGSDVDRELVAGLLAVQSGFETGDDLTMARHEDQRLAGLAGIDVLAGGSADFVVHAHNGVLDDIHGARFFLPAGGGRQHAFARLKPSGFIASV